MKILPLKMVVLGRPQVICSSTLMEAVVDGYNSATVGQQAQYDPTTGNLMWPEASPWANFFAKYLFRGICIHNRSHNLHLILGLNHAYIFPE